MSKKMQPVATIGNESIFYKPMGSVDCNAVTCRRRYFEDMFFRKSNKSLLIKNRGIVSHHVHIPYHDLICASNIEKDAYLFQIDRINRCTRYIQTMNHKPADMYYQFASHDDLLAVFDKSLTICSRSNACYQFLLEYEHLNILKHVSFIDRNNILECDYMNEVRMMDLRCRPKNNGEIKMRSREDIGNMHVLRVPKYDGLCEQVDRRRTSVGACDLARGGVGDDGVVPKVKETAMNACFKMSESSNYIITQMLTHVQCWDVRKFTTAIETKHFPRKIEKTMVVNGTDLWSLDKEGGLSLLNTKHIQRDPLYMESTELAKAPIREFEATEDYLFAVSNNGDLSMFYSTLPISSMGPVNKSRFRFPLTTSTSVDGTTLAVSQMSEPIEIFSMKDTLMSHLSQSSGR